MSELTAPCTDEVSAEYYRKNTRKRQRGNLMQKWTKCQGCNVVFVDIAPLVEKVSGEGPEERTT